MKNFNLFTYRFARKVIGFIVLGMINYYILAKIDTSLEVFMYLLGNSFGLYFILEFASYGTDEYVEIDFRSESKKIQDNIDRQKKLIAGAKERILYDIACGEITQQQALNRLEGIELVEQRLKEPLLLSNQNIEFV